MMDIDLVIVPGCPNESAAFRLLRSTLDQAGMADQGIRVTFVADEKTATSTGFVGSPTFLIDGVDPFSESTTLNGFTCRLYRQSSGPALGLPPINALQNALTVATRQSAPAAEPQHD